LIVESRILDESPKKFVKIFLEIFLEKTIDARSVLRCSIADHVRERWSIRRLIGSSVRRCLPLRSRI